MGAHVKTQFSFLVASLMVAGVASPADADSLSAKYDGSLKEKAHTVFVESSSNDLLLRVRREIRNTGKRVEQAELDITLPPSAVVVGLRSKQGDRWIPGSLLDAQVAATTFDHFTTTGTNGKYGPALLAWEEEGKQSLHIFPVAPGDTAIVEYELRVPTCYQKGRRIAFYPRVEEDSELRIPRLRFNKGAKGRIVRHKSALRVGDREAVEACWEAGMVHQIDGLDEHQILVLDDARVNPVSVRYGLHALEGGRSIGELFVELAPEMASLPKDAELVFVLDASISQGKEQLRQQLMLVQGYLAHVPDAQFQIVLARRRAERVFPSFQPARNAPRLLAGLRTHLPGLGNGSNLDAATAMASSLLAKDTEHPQRIVAFTDARLRESLDSESMRAALSAAPRALMHVVDFQGGDDDYEFDRNDDHSLASAVMASGGMWVTMFGEGNAAAAKVGMLGLVRPTGIDLVSVEGGEPWANRASVPEVLPEGFGFRSMSVLEEAATPVTVRGKVWGRDFSATAEHDSSISQRIPALAFGRNLESELTTREKRTLAQLGQVVSPVTSYLARKPGLSPSGYDYSEGFASSSSMMFSSSHSSSCGGFGSMGYGSVEPQSEETIDFGAAIGGLLEARAATCATLHGTSNSRLTLQVETTGREIVDVEAERAGAYGTCVAEAAWELRLGDFFRQHNGRVTVEVSY